MVVVVMDSERRRISYMSHTQRQRSVVGRGITVSCERVRDTRQTDKPEEEPEANSQRVRGERYWLKKKKRACDIQQQQPQQQQAATAAAGGREGREGQGRDGRV